MEVTMEIWEDIGTGDGEMEPAQDLATPVSSDSKGSCLDFLSSNITNGMLKAVEEEAVFLHGSEGPDASSQALLTHAIDAATGSGKRLVSVARFIMAARSLDLSRSAAVPGLTPRSDLDRRRIELGEEGNKARAAARCGDMGGGMTSCSSCI